MLKLTNDGEIMKKLNSKGFSAVEVILLMVIVAIIGGAGYYIYQANDENSATEDTPLSQEVDTQDDQSNEVASLPTYSLPEGWSELECDSVDSVARLASPGTDKAVDCDDRSNTVLVFDSSGIEACMTDEEVNNMNKIKPISDYKCKAITVDDTEVLRVEADYGGGLSLSYVFQGNKSLTVTYYSGDNGVLTYANEVEELVQSVKF